MFVDFNILNQLGSPSINSNTFANRPAAGQTGRLFVSTDTFEIFRDNGTGWDLIGGPGAGTITGTGTATQVAYFSGAQTIGSSANLFWDNTNSFLGVGTSAPTAGVHVVDTDAFGMYSQITTVAGTTATSVGLYAKNTTNFFGYAAIFDENTPNSASGQYPILIRHSLSSGTAAANMATGIHFGLPDDAGTERINQFSMDTTDPAAATYSSRYRFLLRNNGSAVTPFYITGTGIGVFTATPGAALDIHSTGIMAQLNSTSATANSFLAFQRSGNGLWRIGDAYNGGNNYFELHNTVLTNNAIEVTAANNKSTFTALETYASGLATGNQFTYNLTVPNGVNITQPNAVGAVNSYLNLSLGGNTTVSVGARQGLEGNSRISFTGAGTLTIAQGSTVRAFSALSSVYSFNGTAAGTVTHLAGLRICFPDNIGSAINITNNYGLLLNDQTTGTGTVTYTNRWGIYQEGASDLNYLNGNLLIKSTTNTGEALQVTGTAKVTSTLTANSLVKSGGTASQILAADGSVITAGTNITIAAGQISSTGSGISGSGTTNYLPKFTAATTLGNSNLLDDGSNLSLSLNTFRIKNGVGNTSFVRAEENTTNASFTYLTMDARSTGYLSFSTNDLERMRITSAGLVGIGTASPLTRLHSVGDGAIIQRSSADAFGSAFDFLKSRGTATSPANVNDGDGLLQMRFAAYSGGDYRFTNIILGTVDGTFTSGQTPPSRLGFFTNTAGGSATERLRITSGGSIGIATSTPGSTLQVNGGAAIGYSASTAAPTNGLIVAGQSTFSDAVTVTRNQNALTSLTVSNTTNNTGAYASVSVRSNSNGLIELGKYAQLKTAYKILSSGAGYIYNAESGDIAILNDFSTGNITFAAGGSSTAHLTITSAGNITLADAVNIAVNTTTGTKIGTATNQKLAFWNATPIVQPTTAVAGAARVGGGGTTVTDTDTFGGYTIAQVVQALRNTGILA